MINLASVRNMFPEVLVSRQVNQHHRSDVTKSEKVKAVNFALDNTRDKAAKKFNVNRRTLNGWIQEHESKGY